MKHFIKILRTIFILLIVILTACKKEEIDLPEVTTNYVKYIRRTSATLDGSFFLKETDSLLSHGFCWSTKNLPTVNDNITKSPGAPEHFGSLIHGLTPNTTYYARAYVTNQDGTGYGMEKNFTTLQANSSITFNPDLNYGTVEDIEGNSYKTIEIGTQTWMAENLRTKLYNDNTEIPLITDFDDWEHLTTPGYCWYENNEELYKNLYGAYYNWYTVNTGKLCPEGWHVPSDEEWKTLEIHIGMSPEQTESWGNRGGTSEALKIKETGTGNWAPDDNINGTNESGFTALPGGLRWPYDLDFSGEGIISFWWTSSGFFLEMSNQHATSRFIYNFNSMLYRDSRQLEWGFNVRCVKD